jgi:hypothetical protein
MANLQIHFFRIEIKERTPHSQISVVWELISLFILTQGFEAIDIMYRIGYYHSFFLGLEG